jgi:hypothetical protein
VQDALRADSETEWSCHSLGKYQLTDNLHLQVPNTRTPSYYSIL